jgi:AcrR family transcriptional regulator
MGAEPVSESVSESMSELDEARTRVPGVGSAWKWTRHVIVLYDVVACIGCRVWSGGVVVVRADRKAQRAKRGQTAPVMPEAVLDRAASMFLAQGYYRTRMSDIADSFGVTHAALYYHFQNKQDILSQINKRAISELLERADRIVAKDLEPSDTLLGLLRSHLSYVAESPAFVATLLEHDLEIPAEDFDEIQAMRREYTGVVVSAYDGARALGEAPDVDSNLAVSLLIGSCNWVYRWYRPDGGLAPDELVDQAMVLLGTLMRR